MRIADLTVELTVKPLKTGEKVGTFEHNKKGLKKRKRTEKPNEQEQLSIPRWRMYPLDKAQALVQNNQLYTTSSTLGLLMPAVRHTMARLAVEEFPSAGMLLSLEQFYRQTVKRTVTSSLTSNAVLPHTRREGNEVRYFFEDGQEEYVRTHPLSFGRQVHHDEGFKVIYVSGYGLGVIRGQSQKGEMLQIEK